MRILMTKKMRTIVVMLFGFTFSGCSKQSSVISFVPVEPFKPNSGAELLEKLDSHLPFNVSPENFICTYKSDPDRLIGWIVIPTVEQKEIVKERLKQSSTLKLLQVESLTPEMKALFKKEWKQSQTVGAPSK